MQISAENCLQIWEDLAYMTNSVLQIGTRLAANVHEASDLSVCKGRELNTLNDLLNILEEHHPRSLPMLLSTSSKLSEYLEKPAEKILLDSVYESRDEFRPFLARSKYKENSIRSYVNYLRILLNSAREMGWKPNETVSEAWLGVTALAVQRKCKRIVKYFARAKRSPLDVTIEDADRWAQLMVERGHSHKHMMREKTLFWRLLRDSDCTNLTPKCILREEKYAIPFEQLPPALKLEILQLLQWKQASFNPDRSKRGKHRAISAKRLRQVICSVYGYAVRVHPEVEIKSLSQLGEEELIKGFVSFCINARGIEGQSVERYLAMFPGALRSHPSYSSLNFRWFNNLINSLPIEAESEKERRKAAKFLEYSVVEAIPAKIHAERMVIAKANTNPISRVAMEELLMKWIAILPWRQRNIRECRIGGSSPNLFKGPVSPLSRIDRPEWVTREEQRNPAAQFWQFKFARDETKTSVEPHCLLPRQLIAPLEEYLDRFRCHLFSDHDPGTLFVSDDGQQMSVEEIADLVCAMTLKYGGRRVTPHIFRDIFAFAFLKRYPKDFLTLSKILWHSNVSTTIKIYGSGFNWSSGVCATEAWLDEREAKSK